MADGPEEDPPAAVQTVPAPPRHVGAMLKRARESLGEELRFAANHLCIRESYLRAIEDGRFEDLPGHAYAIGFVRAYAAYLNLDGEKIVQRFKDEEADGVDPKPELVVPAPPSESRRPGTALVLASLMLAAGIYGTWFYLSTQGRLVTESPAIDLPAKPVLMADRPPAPAPNPVAAAPVALPPASAPTAASPPAGGPVRPPAGDVTPPAASATAPIAVANPSAPSVAALPGAEDSDDAEIAEVPPPPEPLRQAARGSGSLLQGAPPSAEFDQTMQEGVARPPISPSSANAATVDDQATKVARPAGPSRVIIHAIADSWLQISDGRAPSIFAQVLRAGETYHVPNRAGLRFDTGNAGGLEITVDGKPVPPVGPSGSVRRNIPLDADKLLAGAFGQR